MKKESEDRIQGQIYEAYNNAYCLKTENPRSMIFHVPNQNQFKLCSMGILAGASDLIIIHAPHNNKLYFVELKTPEAYAKKDNGMSDAQLEFQSRVEALGYTYLLFYKAEDFCLFFGI